MNAGMFIDDERFDDTWWPGPPREYESTTFVEIGHAVSVQIRNIQNHLSNWSGIFLSQNTALEPPRNPALKKKHHYYTNTPHSMASENNRVFNHRGQKKY